MNQLVENPTLSDEQKQRLLAIVAKDPQIGTVAAAKQAGVEGTRGQVRALLEPLQEEIREARGWSLVKVEQTAWDVALNPEHPSWDRANARILKAYHPAYRDTQHVQVDADVTVERREVSLHGILAVLADAGALDELGQPGLVGALASARELLPAQPD